MIHHRETIEATVLEIGNSGSTFQPAAHTDDFRVLTSYSSDTEPFKSPTTEGEIVGEAFAGQFSSSSSYDKDLLQLLDSFKDAPQWSDIAIHRTPTPFLPQAFDAIQEQLEAAIEPLSFTTLFKDTPAPVVQSDSGHDNAHVISGVDENAPIRPGVAQTHTLVDLHHFPQIPEQWTRKSSQTLFPILSTFTPPVSGLPEWPALYHTFHHTATVQAPADPTGPRFFGAFDGHLHPSAVTNNDLEMGPNGAYLTPAVYQWHSTQSQTAVEPIMQGYSDHASRAMMHATIVPGTLVPCSHVSLGLSGNPLLQPLVSTAHDMLNPSIKRKANDEYRIAIAGPSSPPVGTETRKRRRVGRAKIEMTKFGAYAVADANATAMPEPLTDYDPADVNSRRNIDPDGNILRTRKYGIMEIDDSYGNRSATVSKELPAHLTCVRPCEWSNSPCGLYIEMCKDRISDHLFKWHGVCAHEKAPCNFQGCTDTSAMNNLGRHIETVHYATSWQCLYCRKPLSRSDAAARHRKTCEPFKRMEHQPAQAGHKMQSAKKVVTGYIIPARGVA